MSSKIYKVLQQGPVTQQPSKKTENGVYSKCTLTLQEFGGKYENTYQCTLLGNAAQCCFCEGELVVASLRFTVSEHNGQFYQDITVNDIVKLK